MKTIYFIVSKSRLYWVKRSRKQGTTSTNNQTIPCQRSSKIFGIPKINFRLRHNFEGGFAHYITVRNHEKKDAKQQEKPGFKSGSDTYCDFVQFISWDLSSLICERFLHG